ncbi:succinate dehydrogenase cytochrome b subunit [Ornithobacterium rhinotracheale]|uniref:Succinate dehydrogenase cytochrome b subunit n=1 Tax=Ornithobacterium rhinotracheale TaxID=28251 RepID=A0A3R5Y2D5_ORNRH|nr:succinate dehydrogenase cytochrome b subunit [Ornithobacterium rhinotracheale]QAR30147.1 succinate dehydrogenase cytochrome b subunit [Ornithobacterium rhinotracheale]
MAQGLFNSSIGRKFAMALSAMFLLIFLIVHLLVNMLSVISPDAFNEASHFMGTNPLVQFLFQPILMLGVVFHFVMGFVLEIKNRKARGPVGYQVNNAGANSTWISRNMIVTGGFILLFLLFHFKDFWVHEMVYKYVKHSSEDPYRYYGEMVEMFSNPLRVAVYVLAFIFLGMHLLHGFQSSFQSLGANHRKYNGFIKAFGVAYSIIIPLGFIFIALFHFFTHK